MDFLLGAAGIVIFGTLVFLLVDRFGYFFTYGGKRKKQEMLTNQEIAASDKFVKLIAWILNIQIPALAIILPFVFLRESSFYRYYLLGIFCYAIVAFIAGRRSLPKLRLNVRAMRLGLTSVVVLTAIVWPLTLFTWHRLEGSVPEYERIKYVHQKSGKR